MKGLILLADHFEDVEALITIDMLRRAKIQIDLVSMTNNIELTTQSNVKLLADYLLKDINTMTLAELKEMAKIKGIKGYSKLKKDELLEVLK